MHELRAAGFGVHLATNQERRRAAYMREVLGYDELFDSSYYSCDLSHLKVEPEFFEAVIADLGVPADEVLPGDDREKNVLVARDVGLRAERGGSATASTPCARRWRGTAYSADG